MLSQARLLRFWALGSNCVLTGFSMFPGLVITDHRIEGDEHFAHQGNGGDLGGFAGGDEAPVEIAERGFAAGGGPGGHVEGGAHGCASAGDGSRSLRLAAVVIEGGKTDQGGDGAADRGFRAWYRRPRRSGQ